MTTDSDLPAGSADIPSADLPGDAFQPETQGADPVDAELGEDGQGDLAPEDLGDERPGDDSEAEATPQDLRTELPGDASDPAAGIPPVGSA
ncbi:hypothetical protein MICABA_00739 [Microbacterium sp. T2.11-28]|nr:hypothetical protein MICABA_00739 [Microbacterium sp. T2.11-28]